ncbi:hypothetical protein SCHPADRAFT_852288 [Schizopora paradoxa]|uniref:BTB domain-containing protein n=1 Tax=Schizopora paradoxa TaxID=27342 RepID=A0A0H2RPP8_9AGAM|nr:hypothetical protein SCHPADRAFT_852288 [Schizopora paradoxa]
MSSQVPGKRPEKRHDTLWFSDGNVVLSAVEESTGDAIVFRIHKSSLAKQSKVFESMFKLPQGKNTDGGVVEAYGGLKLPLVRVPDAAEDVEALLEALYDPLPLFQKPLFSDTPLRLRRALHMASKYLMDDLRLKLIRIVEYEWPNDLDNMEEKDRIMDDIIDRHEGFFAVTHWPAHFIPEPAAAIALAEDFDIPTILPFAYYDLLRCSPGSNWDEDFDKEIEDAMFRFKVTKMGGKSARWDTLSANSLLKTLQLQEYIERQYNTQFQMFRTRIYQCRRPPSECQKTWLDLLKKFGELPGSVQGRDIIRTLRDLDFELTGAEPLGLVCTVCRIVYSSHIYEARTNVWNGVENICSAR